MILSSVMCVRVFESSKEKLGQRYDMRGKLCQTEEEEAFLLLTVVLETTPPPPGSLLYIDYEVRPGTSDFGNYTSTCCDTVYGASIFLSRDGESVRRAKCTSTAALGLGTNAWPWKQHCTAHIACCGDTSNSLL